MIVRAEGSNCQVDMTSSEVVGTSAIAEVTQNANLSIMNNTIDVHSYLFVVAANDRGQIRFHEP